jgi:hypothetical protein
MRIRFSRWRSSSEEILREKRDVAGNASALLGDRLFGDLDQDLLSLLQQFANDGQVGELRICPAATPAASAVRASATTRAAPSAPTIVGATVATGWRWRRRSGLLLAGFFFTLFLVDVGFRFTVFNLGIVLFGYAIGRSAYTLFKVGVANHLAQFSAADVVEGLFFQIIEVVLVAVGAKRFEVIFFFFDDFFFDGARARREAARAVGKLVLFVVKRFNLCNRRQLSYGRVAAGCGFMQRSLDSFRNCFA